MKRFYKLVSTQKVATGYEILLDGRPVKTALKNTLCVEKEELANELVKEWAAQGENIIPDTMPLTQIVNTRIDRVSQERAAMSQAVLKYLDTDLLCYRTDDPPELAAAQEEAWDPVLTWFAGRFGVELETTTALTALEQPGAAHEEVRSCVEKLDDDRFTILQLVTPLSGSLVLAIAFLEGEVSAQQVFGCAHVEEHFKAEIYNEEKYGPDPAEEKKDRAMLSDLKAAEIFLGLSA